ncbi:MAG: flagellar protein [Melioribacteraceae bacterium]|nr:flagellar protein [Melioribacteraceae bacterium]
MAELNGVKVPFVPIVGNNNGYKAPAGNVKSNFDEIFNSELEKVKFSNHALRRLESRNITLDNDQLNKIQTAVERAQLKGAKDSLVMMNDTAFIVNIANRTIITAMDVKESKENVFTNIDSVVFA